MKISKNQYLGTFATVVLLLAILRLCFPQVAGQLDRDNPDDLAQNIERGVGQGDQEQAQDDKQKSLEQARAPQEKAAKEKALQEKAREAEEARAKAEQARAEKEKAEQAAKPTAAQQVVAAAKPSRFLNADGTPVKHRIFSVSRYTDAFPDSQQVQILAAEKWGVSPVRDRRDAEARKRELVYMNASPYYHVDKMYRSIPYLVPRAVVLLNDIGRAFYDSLQLKGIPIHQFIITSVLRTQEDVKKLRNYNGNATENSCHLYGTTFDICYNRYKTVEPPGERRRQVRNDSLKFVLSEVLNDMRRNNRCYIKYEVKQGCFHITVR